MRTKDYHHWHYFALLSSELELTGRYVELDEDNFKTYSFEFLRLYLSIGSEVDVVAKLLCKKVVPTSQASNMPSYRKAILSKHPDMPQTKVVIPALDMPSTPWSDWQLDKSPAWWEDYNKVKHHRDAFFNAANLQNCLNSLAGLLVLLGYLYAEALSDFKLKTDKLFTFDNSYCCGSSWSANGLCRGFALPGIPKPKRR